MCSEEGSPNINIYQISEHKTKPPEEITFYHIIRFMCCYVLSIQWIDDSLLICKLVLLKFINICKKHKTIPHQKLSCSTTSGGTRNFLWGHQGGKCVSERAKNPKNLPIIADFSLFSPSSDWGESGRGTELQDWGTMPPPPLVPILSTTFPI